MSTRPAEQLNATEIDEAINKIVEELRARIEDEPDPCLIGVQRRGDILAHRVRDRLVQEASDHADVLPIGSLDITLYRDDFDSLTEAPVVGQTNIPFSLDGRSVVLFDDVLFTGRTIRAALEELHELGRPDRVLLAVLVDRGWRELPIAADIVGIDLETARSDNVQVLLSELDGAEEIQVFRQGSAV